MSTRSNIGMKLADGRVKAIYCHWDGYPEGGGVGNTLRKYYTNKERVESLLDLGDLSSLGKKIYPSGTGEHHTFYNSEEDVTVAYHRDRGEKFHDTIYDSVADYAASMKDSWAEFLYLYDTDGKRYVYSTYLKPEYGPNKWNDLEWLINEIEKNRSAAE